MSTQPITPSGREADTAASVHDLIRTRWSPRAFTDRPVSNEDLFTILEAARWAASSYNEQPWRFIVARKTDGPLYDKLLHVLVPMNQEWASKAPVLILTVAKRTFSHNGAPNDWATHDTGAALAHIMLQAIALGLHAHGMAGFDKEKARKDLNIPEDFEPVTALALGYAGPHTLLPESMQGKETGPRQRKPLSDLAFNGSWNQPLALG